MEKEIDAIEERNKTLSFDICTKGSAAPTRRTYRQAIISTCSHDRNLSTIHKAFKRDIDYRRIS
jgi:hypothetical protein